MKVFSLIITLFLCFSCSIETKDGCVSTNTETCTNPPQEQDPKPKSKEEQSQNDDKKSSDDEKQVNTCTPEENRSCISGQISNINLNIGDSHFSDAEEFNRYLIKMLYTIGEEVDHNNDGIYLKPRNSITNNNFGANFDVTIVGIQNHRLRIYSRDAKFVYNKLLPYEEYKIRAVREIELIERDSDQQIFVEKCLRLEYENYEESFYTEFESQHLFKPLSRFKVKLYDTACNSSSTTGIDFRYVELPSVEDSENNTAEE